MGLQSVRPADPRPLEAKAVRTARSPGSSGSNPGAGHPGGEQELADPPTTGHPAIPHPISRCSEARGSSSVQV